CGGYAEVAEQGPQGGGKTHVAAGECGEPSSYSFFWDSIGPRNTEGTAMNILLWVLQVLAALLYGASGVMKVFLFDKVSGDVPSFGALPRQARAALGIVELVCSVGLIVP